MAQAAVDAIDFVRECSADNGTFYYDNQILVSQEQDEEYSYIEINITYNMYLDTRESYDCSGINPPEQYVVDAYFSVEDFSVVYTDADGDVIFDISKDIKLDEEYITETLYD